MTERIGTYLQDEEKKWPPLLFSVLAQTIYNQYEPLSPDGAILVAGLSKLNLLEPCLFAIQSLTSEGSPFPFSLSANLLKLGLQILKQSSFHGEGPLKEAIDHIFRASETLQEDELRDLLKKAGHAMAAGGSLIFAQEGLRMLKRCIHDHEDRLACRSLQPPENDPFCTQKFFLRAIDTYLLKEPFRLRLNQLQKDSLLQCALALLTAPDAPNLLLTDPGMQLISKRILDKSFAECSAPDTPRRIHLIESILYTPYITLFQLQFLMLWMQDAIDGQEGLSILAGSRQRDLEGNLCRFAMMRFEKLAKQTPEELDILRQLLRFIYCWRAAPANQELLSDPKLEAGWQICSLILHERSDLQELQEQMEREFYIPTDLWTSERPFPAENPAQEPEFLWECESAVRVFRDSLLSYFLQGQEVKVADLIRHPEDTSLAMRMQIKKFDQVVQYLVDQLLQKSCSFNEIERMVKVLCLAEKALVKEGAFQPALAIHAAFHQASIKRLWGAFQCPLFLSRIGDENSWSSGKGNFQKLKAMQAEHPTAFEVFSLVLHALTHVREIPEFTERGEINLHRLRILGDLFNGFSVRKGKARRYWAEANLHPSPFLVDEFAKQSGALDEKGLLDQWWDRSQEIHHFRSPHYWGSRPRQKFRPQSLLFNE